MDVRMKILGDEIPFSSGSRSIYEIKFLRDNPRVYSVTHGVPGFDDLSPEEQQNRIFEKLKDESSVKNLIPDVKRHKGLIEPILVSVETMEVIEGNSRLAVYRILHEKRYSGEWDLIPCYLVTGLTSKQQEAFLSQVHIKGRTKWSAYEKANFAYVRKESGRTVEQIAKLLGEHDTTTRTRVNAIEFMKQNDDDNKNRFSYYDVLVRNKDIRQALEDSSTFRERVVREIKSLDVDSEIEPHVTAKDLRDKLPDIIRKPKVLRRYMAGEIELGEAWQRAKVSHAEERIKDARSLLEGISRMDIDTLDRNALNSLKQSVKKLARALDRVRDMVGSGDAR